MEQELIKAQALFDYYTERVNRDRANGDFQGANGWLYMLLGAMAMFDALQGAECTLDEQDGIISVTVYEAD